jgi:hypothetical protein
VWVGLELKRVLGAVGILFAFYFPVALLLRASYSPPTGPPGGFYLMVRTFHHHGGHAYVSSIPKAARKLADRKDAPNNSPVIIYEDGKPLPHPHSLTKDIITFGSGRFTHWDDGGGGSGVVFSSSDNSDPNKNGREYWAVVPGATREELRELGSWSTSAQR